MRLRPYRSPRTPQVKSIAAKTQVYELTDQTSCSVVAPRSFWIVGSATLSTVLSSTTTTRLTTRTLSAAQRRG